MGVELLPDLGLTVLQGWQAGSVSAVINSLTRPEFLIAAAAGGAFGAALGALPAFIFTGFLVMAGVAGGGMVGIGFGPVFGPHVSFAGGAAAAAYAAKKGVMESGFDYHNAKDITVALGLKPDILAVGAGFGVFGVLMEQTFRQLAVPTDPIAITVFGSAILHRIVFGYPIIGVVSEKADGYFDMTPFERGDIRPAGEVPFGDGEKEGTDMLAVEPWLPHQYKWSHVAGIGLVAGAAAGYAGMQVAMAIAPEGASLAQAPAAPGVFLGFGISAATLLFLNLGVDVPVTHHMTLPGATAFFAVTQAGSGMLAGQPAVVGIIMAAIFGMIGALLGEIVQRIVYAHGQTHVDPPATSIFINHILIALLALGGVFATAVWVPGAAF